MSVHFLCDLDPGYILTQFKRDLFKQENIYAKFNCINYIFSVKYLNTTKVGLSGLLLAFHAQPGGWQRF